MAALVWLAVFIAAYLGTTPVYAGEHPWDNDNGHPGSTGGGSYDPGDVDHPGVSVTSTLSSSAGRTVQTTTTSSVPTSWTLMFRASEWVFVKWTGAKGSVAPAVTKSVEQLRLVK
ncbi:MAG: hypothetical protein WAU88_16640 [Candidatus Zixiibacteriota bacterium]